MRRIRLEKNKMRAPCSCCERTKGVKTLRFITNVGPKLTQGTLLFLCKKHRRELFELLYLSTKPTKLKKKEK